MTKQEAIDKFGADVVQLAVESYPIRVYGGGESRITFWDLPPSLIRDRLIEAEKIILARKPKAETDEPDKVDTLYIHHVAGTEVDFYLELSATPGNKDYAKEAIIRFVTGAGLSCCVNGVTAEGLDRMADAMKEFASDMRIACGNATTEDYEA